jgi:hypothetical protein
MSVLTELTGAPLGDCPLKGGSGLMG